MKISWNVYKLILILEFLLNDLLDLWPLDPACAWVTQALGEEDIEKALVLGKSLRRVLTRKSLVVIVRATISLALRLVYTFEKLNLTELELHGFTYIFCVRFLQGHSWIHIWLCTFPGRAKMPRSLGSEYGTGRTSQSFYDELYVFRKVYLFAN